jgi:hypothetical protein
MPFVLICHEEARKQASIVYQFHNIWVLLVNINLSRILFKENLQRSCTSLLSLRPYPYCRASRVISMRDDRTIDVFAKVLELYCGANSEVN